MAEPAPGEPDYFFVRRPIVAIVISIVMVILGIVSLVQLPVALYPNKIGRAHV